MALKKNAKLHAKPKGACAHFCVCVCADMCWCGAAFILSRGLVKLSGWSCAFLQEPGWAPQPPGLPGSPCHAPGGLVLQVNCLTGRVLVSAEPTPVKCGEVHCVLFAVTLATLGITAARTRQALLGSRSDFWIRTCTGLTRGPRGTPSPSMGNIPEAARGQTVGVAHVSFGIRRGSRVCPQNPGPGPALEAFSGSLIP